MQTQPFVLQVQDQLASAAALGDDSAQRVAAALVAAAEPAVRLAVLAAVSAAAEEITAALLDSPGSPQVSVRLDDGDLAIEVRAAASAAPEPLGAAEDDDATARISLRLSEALKADIDADARRQAVSVNTWLVRAAATTLSLERPGARPSGGTRLNRSTRHVSGWING